MTNELPIDEITINTLRQEAKSAEKQGHLTNRQLDIFYSQKWLKLYVPETMGGLQLSLPHAVRLLEALAKTDGSLGWIVTLCSGASLFAGFLDQEFAARLFTDHKACFGGSGGSTGIADKNEKGYLVSGRWKYATGAPHNTVFTANCIISENGKWVVDNEGKPVVKSFLFLREEVIVHPDWEMMGLKATASHSFGVNSLQVPDQRCFIISGNEARLSDPIYQYPFLPFAQATLAVNTAGMAMHFLEEANEMFLLKSAGNALMKDRLQRAWLSSFNALQLVRTQFYKAIELSWNECVANRSLSQATVEIVGSVVISWRMMQDRS